MNWKNMVFLGLSGLASLLVENNLNAEEYKLKENKETDISLSEEAQIIKPTLEEITALLSKTPQEILEPTIKESLIKKFEYTRLTTPENFHEFLNRNFENKTIIVFIYIDKITDEKNKHLYTNDGTHEPKVSSASAIVFMYINSNLRKTNFDAGYLFFELKDFYGKNNWSSLFKLFNTRGLDLPSYAEFRKEKDRYVFKEIVPSGVYPKDIPNYIELNVKDILKNHN